MAVLYYLRLAYEYEPNYLSYIGKLKQSEAVYWTPIIFLILSAIIIITQKINPYCQMQKNKIYIF